MRTLYNEDVLHVHDVFGGIRMTFVANISGKMFHAETKTAR